MTKLIWIVYTGGLVLSLVFFGTKGVIVFLAAGTLIITVFRRPLVLALTHLSAKLGWIRATVKTMPSAIHLVGAEGPAESARPLMAPLLAAQFIEAGSWTIPELPAIQVTLMIHPGDGLLAAIESASSIGAQINIHTLYLDGTVFSVTNSELPVSKTTRPNVKRMMFPRCVPTELIRKARELRPAGRFRVLTVAGAPRIYEELYAEEIRFRKGEWA